MATKVSTIQTSAVEKIADGIYFGMSEEVYHADPALSASGIRNLLISPLDYWINSPLNPEYEDRKTDSMVAGTAFHRRLLEPERFAELYAGVPTKDDYPDAIDGADALKAECDRLGLKKNGRIEDLCCRILEAEPSAQLWPVIRNRMIAEADGRILLKPDVIKDIERAARIVEAHQSAARAITGGHSEVSIFWTDPEYGVRMKSRLDYLKVRAIVDVKTFSNIYGRPLDVAITQAVANERYHVQAVVYDTAVSAAKAMLFKRRAAAVTTVSGPEPTVKWLTEFAACQDHAFVFLFIEQGPVTNVRVREFRRFDSPKQRAQAHDAPMPTPNAYWMQGEIGFRTGVKLYAECMKRFGPKVPWIDDQPMRAFADVDFPLWLLG